MTPLRSIGPCVLALGLLGCLPPDDRPEPGRLDMTAEPSAAVTEGFTTPDGWRVRFDRLVAGVGDIRINESFDGSCNDYSSARYTRVFDFTVTGREKVGLVYGLGRCWVEYRLRSPRSNTVLGPGATQSDVEFMRMRASDGYAFDKRVALIATGRAERDGTVKRFDWSFRRSYNLDGCVGATEEQLASVIDLNGGDELALPIVVRGEELFRRAPVEEAPLHFDRFAEADADDDGTITLAELSEVDAPDFDYDAAELTPFEEERLRLAKEALAAAGLDLSDVSLGDLMYQELLPRVSRLASGGACVAELRDQHYF